MARIRSIHPKMHLREDYVTLSVEARVFILALGTFSDYADRFPWDVDAIAAHAPCCNEIPALLSELLSAGMIVRDGDHGEILFAFGFSRRRVSKWENLRSLVFIRDGRTCVYCGSRAQPLHCDHTIPVSRGGSNDLSNLVTACKACNLSKGSKLLEEWEQCR